MRLTYETGAVDRIIAQSESEILKMFILDTDPTNKHWSREQAWHLIKSLATAKDGVVPYHKVLLSSLFKEEGDLSLRALEQAELISISSVNGFPHEIKPGRPVFHTVFKRLADNKILSSRLDLLILTQKIHEQNKAIGVVEEELRLLGSLPKQPRAVTPRVEWLLQKLYESQGKISQYDYQSAVLKKILQSSR